MSTARNNLQRRHRAAKRMAAWRKGHPMAAKSYRFQAHVYMAKYKRLGFIGRQRAINAMASDMYWRSARHPGIKIKLHYPPPNPGPQSLEVINSPLCGASVTLLAEDPVTVALRPYTPEQQAAIWEAVRPTLSHPPAEP